MLLKKENEAISANGMGEGNQFQIAASAKAFEVLSSNLYQNKVLAVIREITCNAIDAHKITGRPVSDIKMHFPNFSQPYFSVRDFGPGLSKENVLQLYTTYFRSTKDNNNDAIGGFGLGSKSPFAVADQFTVTSWHGGKKMTFVCYKQNGVPQVNQVHTEVSDGPTGLEVRVAAANHHEWHHQGGEFLQWQEHIPYHNLNRPVVSAMHSSNILLASSNKVAGLPAWSFLRNNPAQSGIVLMGGVPYGLNLQAIPDLPADVQQMFAQLPIVMSYAIGDLEISPSREMLSYDPRTCDALTKRLQLVFRELCVDLQSKIEALPSLHEARKFVFFHDTGSQIVRAAQRVMRAKQNLTWKGKQIYQAVQITDKDFPDGNTFTIRDYYRRSYHKTWHRDGTGYHTLSDNITWWDEYELVYAETVTAKTYRKLQELADSRTNKAAFFKVVTGVELKDLTRVLEEQGIRVDVLDVATLPDPPKLPAKPRKSPMTKGYVYDWKEKKFDRTETDIDLSAGGIYLEFFDGDPAVSEHMMRLRTLMAIGHVKDDTRILGFRRNNLSSKTFRDKLDANKVVHADEKWAAAQVTEAQLEDYGWQQNMVALFTMAPPFGAVGSVRAATGFGRLAHQLRAELALGNKVPLVLPSNVEAGMLRFAKTPYVYQRGDFSHPTWHACMSAAQIAAYKKGQAAAEQVCREWEAFVAKHPLLQMLHWDAAGGKLTLENIAAYTNR